MHRRLYPLLRKWRILHESGVTDLLSETVRRGSLPKTASRALSHRDRTAGST